MNRKKMLKEDFYAGGISKLNKSGQNWTKNKELKTWILYNFKQKYLIKKLHNYRN